MIALKSWILWILKYTGAVHFTGYIFLFGFWCLKLHAGVIYDLYCQSKLLIKIQIYVIQLGIGFLPFLSVESHIHTEYILVVIIKYKVIRAVPDCYHMPLKLLSDGTMKWLEIPFSLCHHTEARLYVC